MGKKLPVYEIIDFRGKRSAAFYANYLEEHVKAHSFTNLPHKHDFFLVMLVTAGSGWHEIDFVKYKVKSGTAFFMQPGQMHYWKLSGDIKGFVFFHSRAFYEERFFDSRLRDLPFFASYESNPTLTAAPAKLKKAEQLMKEIIHEFHDGGAFSSLKLHALVNLAYIEFARQGHNTKAKGTQGYLVHFDQFRQLIDRHFIELKSAGDYALKMNMTEKHLNRIVRECVGKTSTQLIADRIILEAKRLLMMRDMNVTQVGYELGYDDPSYFVRFFKKQTGLTPRAFLQKYKEEDR
jgi:AraC-like DNA-binding protein